MTEETAKKVSELYKKKSEISKSISEITDKNIKIRGVSYFDNSIRILSLLDIKLDFISELKEFCLNKLNEQLKVVEDEIANIDCKQ